MSNRIEAAGKAVLTEIGDWYPLEGVPHLALHAANLAGKAVAASDSLMFSDEAVERAAKAIHDAGSIDKKPWAERNDGIRELYREDVRLVIAALKGDA